MQRGSRVERLDCLCTNVRERVLMKKKSVIKGKRQTREGGQRKGEGSLKGHHLACSKWQ